MLKHQLIQGLNLGIFRNTEGIVLGRMLDKWWLKKKKKKVPRKYRTFYFLLSVKLFNFPNRPIL